MKRVRVIAVVLLCCSCGPGLTPEPTPQLPTDTPSCGSACAKLHVLGCPEGEPLEDGTTCETFCRQTQESGHALNPSCIMTISKCSDMASKCRQGL